MQGLLRVQQARRQEPQQVQRLRPEQRHPSRRRPQVLREPVRVLPRERVLLRERVLRAAAAELLYCSPPVSTRQARRSVLSVSWFKIPY